jgi:hypothetical protein
MERYDCSFRGGSLQTKKGLAAEKLAQTHVWKTVFRPKPDLFVVQIRRTFTRGVLCGWKN